MASARSARTRKLLAAIVLLAPADCGRSDLPLRFPPRGFRDAPITSLEQNPEFASYARKVGRELYLRHDELTGCGGCHETGAGPRLVGEPLVRGDDLESLYSSIKFGVRVVDRQGNPLPGTKGMVDGKRPEPMPAFSLVLPDHDVLELATLITPLRP